MRLASRSIPTSTARSVLSSSQSISSSAKVRASGRGVTRFERQTPGVTAARIFPILAGSPPSQHLPELPHASPPRQNGRSRRRSARCHRRSAPEGSKNAATATWVRSGKGDREVDRQARWARSRCTVPDTPLSSTGPMSANVIPVSDEASAAAWLTRTSPCRA